MCVCMCVCVCLYIYIYINLIIHFPNCLFTSFNRSLFLPTFPLPLILLGLILFASMHFFSFNKF